MENKVQKIIVIGGGAAGFFYAINKAKNNPATEIIILEKSDEVLEKVRVSGGGRCNVTHQCFEAKELVKNYPRGSKELVSPFYTFNPQQTIDWFAERGVAIKAEADGRMFPVSDDSATIIHCFLQEIKKYNIKIYTSQDVDAISFEDEKWIVKTSRQALFEADSIYIATGSSLRMWKMLEQLGYQINLPIPSLFTFTIKDERLNDLMGVSVPAATIKINNEKLQQTGPVLITHWGVSGPAVLKLSAFAAKYFHEKKYKVQIAINWTGDLKKEVCLQKLLTYKDENAKKMVVNYPLFNLPSRLWQKLVGHCHLTEKKWADAPKKDLDNLSNQLTAAIFEVTGKSTFKEEFVTCGGVALSQIDFKTYQSKLHKNLYFGGEVLDIDAITGGFNFQAAWTSAWIAANA